MFARTASLRMSGIASSMQTRGISKLVGSQLHRGIRNQVDRNSHRRFDGMTSLTRSCKRVFSEGKQRQKVEKVVVEEAAAVKQTMLQRWLGPKVMPAKGTFQWYREMVLLCTVFAITGSSTMFLVRPAMSEVLGLKGSFRDGPWTYRIGSVVIMTPLYATLLVVVGTTFGRHTYFRHFAVKMFSRFGIPPELMDSTFHETAKHFRKW